MMHVHRHGRVIAVDTVAERKSGPFLLLPWEWYERAVAAARPRSLDTLVVGEWIYRQWRMRKRGVDSIKVGNIALGKLGVSPDAKTSALSRLEAAGLIRVQRQPRKSPRITVLEIERPSEDGANAVPNVQRQPMDRN
jgi:DNA-binding transcriptional ArsR family regulator